MSDPQPAMPPPTRRVKLWLAAGAGAAALLLATAAPVAVAPNPAGLPSHDLDAPTQLLKNGASGSLLSGAGSGVGGHLGEHDSPDDLVRAQAHNLGDGGGDGGGFFAAFTQSLLLILACELGDRTFFVAAILAMKAPRLVVFAGAISALALMTVLSALIGRAFPVILDKKWTSIAASILFAYFGIQLLRSWWGMRNEEPAENEELAEVEEELADDKSDGRKSLSLSRSMGGLGALLSPVFIKSFTMTGLAEWGDRSQIATIALAAQQDMWGVVLGGIVGHACCTTLAVVGGRLLATRISEKAVALVGGLLFVSFAVLTASGKLE
jgi:Ca2+/H+ antiporter, TMEM165/GDT1 family